MSLSEHQSGIKVCHEQGTLIENLSFPREKREKHGAHEWRPPLATVAPPLTSAERGKDAQGTIKIHMDTDFTSGLAHFLHNIGSD